MTTFLQLITSDDGGFPKWKFSASKLSKGWDKLNCKHLEIPQKNKTVSFGFIPSFLGVGFNFSEDVTYKQIQQKPILSPPFFLLQVAKSIDMSSF